LFYRNRTVTSTVDNSSVLVENGLLRTAIGPNTFL
jgi:hypothetical protein